MTSWRVPNNLDKVLKRYEGTRQLAWFKQWLQDRNKDYLGYEYEKWSFLYDLGYPRIRLQSAKMLPPPQRIVNMFKTQKEPSQSHAEYMKDLERIAKEHEVLKKRYEELLKATKNISVTKVDDSCRKLEKVVQKQKEEIQSLRKQLSLHTDAPPAPMVSPQEADEMVQELRQDAKALDEVVQKAQNIPEPPPPPIPPVLKFPPGSQPVDDRSKRTLRQNQRKETPSEESPSPKSGLEQAMENMRRKQGYNVDASDDDDSDSDGFVDCEICGTPTELTCSNCKNIQYCSRDCQAQDWDFHQEFCASQVF